MGRPTRYTKEIADEICARLSNGESLLSICESDDRFPGESTVRNWDDDDRDGFSAKYARARKHQALHWAEELITIGDNDNKDDTQRARLRVDTRKWVISKILPKIYGDKQTHEVTGADGAPLEVNVTRTIIKPDSES
jgi:hypothetical protein